MLFVTPSLVSTVREPGFLPFWDLTKRRTLNELWIENGRFGGDVYASGDISYLTIRQLRAHGFIFVRMKGEEIRTKDGDAPTDVVVTQQMLNDTITGWGLENQIGKARMRMRRGFGDALRLYALARVRELHGCEAETLMMADPSKHRLYGMPKSTVKYQSWHYCEKDLVENDTREKKLVAMLDYIIYSAEVVVYVGCGDLQTMYAFRDLDRRRFDRIRWICVDPIVPPSKYKNVITIPSAILEPCDMEHICQMWNREEAVLLWDVRSDREDRTNAEWETLTYHQDYLGEQIAKTYINKFAYALLKRRIPRFRETVPIWTSVLLPQPYAGDDMYELRNFVRLKGYIRQERVHLPYPTTTMCDVKDLQDMAEYANKLKFGRDLKRRHFEHLHIVYENGLEHHNQNSRADLFYLTNMRNVTKISKIYDVISESQIATLWIGDSTYTGYDDFTFETRKAMLMISDAKRMVIDGLGFMLLLMWKKELLPEYNILKTSFDPSWASNFMIVCERPKHEFVPDMSLSRFIGIRRHSAHYRTHAPHLYRASDLAKAAGLDVSGHLLIALVTGKYSFDMYWWVRMILEWSKLNAKEKVAALQNCKAQVIEWKEEAAEKPWHRKEDLIGALQCAKQMKIPSLEDDMLDRWIETLRSS